MSFLSFLAALGGPSGWGEYTLHAVPPQGLDEFLAANPGAVKASALATRLDLADAYEAADALRRRIAQASADNPGCVIFCT